MAWTIAQQKVIDARNKNLLVSAAAGSGKTAVLVERIIQMITEGEHPLDIDRLLVVTFTNAAAAEMRERIGKAIDQKLKDNPDNEHLQKQNSLLQSANITTIHSFCLNVIRNYFHRIDLDPSFKIAEESEITLMKSDVMADVLERWYEEGREDFHAFIESYSYSKSDTPIEELVLQLYNFSMSDPWPKTWIADKKGMFALENLEDMLLAPWMEELLGYVASVLGDLSGKNREAMDLCNEAGGPAAYLPALLSDHRLLSELMEARTYEESAALFQGIAFERLSNKKEETEPWKKEKVKALREEVKKGLKDLSNQFFFQSPEEMFEDMRAVDQVMQVLFDLTLEFMEEFAKKKEEKNLIDFNDIEHLALKILIQDEEKEVLKETEESKKDRLPVNMKASAARKVPTQAALELSEQFEEILIDEYQDSNMVQETILRSISKEDMGAPNRFMVGDVKQSIYKFRLAMPEIFMEKYGKYSMEEDDPEGNRNLYQRIDLDRNFRSRATVLDYVNKIFEQIMQESVGGIVYDEAAALKYGGLYDGEAQFDPGIDGERGILEARLPGGVELLLVTDEELETEDGATLGSDGAGKDKDLADSGAGPTSAKAGSEAGLDGETEEEGAYTKKELEARAIAKKIRELTDPVDGMLVLDKEKKVYRPAQCRDIVILLRSMSAWSEVFVNTLMQEGIAAYADTGTGYFQTLEIRTLLNLLRIIDNPRQDIPLVGVLYSPIVGLTSTGLATLRAANRGVGMYQALLAYGEEGSDGELKDKVRDFLSLLEKYRSMVNYKPIHELIQLVLDETGYYYYISAMPGGDRRKANVDMLVSQAVRFEKGSYSGLFHFIRYMEKLHKYEIDFGEASTSGEQDNTIRIMSIHKSKGLEFPIVIVAGMSKSFNTQDLRSSIVLHSELGAGPECIDSKLRTKIPTLLKKVIQKKIQIENLGEELRVLYVAMTRAKEKLILTGFIKSVEALKGKEFSFFELLSAKSYMDWVLPAMVNRMGKQPEILDPPYEWKREDMAISVHPLSEILRQEVAKQIFLNKDREDLIRINAKEPGDPGLRDEIRRRFDYSYPYLNEAGLKIKMTVSELKKLGQNLDEEHSLQLYPEQGRQPYLEQGQQPYLKQGRQPYLEQDLQPYPGQRPVLRTEPEAVTVPSFIKQEEKVVSGTDRGTLYHKVLELLELSEVQDKTAVRAQIDRMIAQGHIKQEDSEKIKLNYIYLFSQSNIAKRMQKARLEQKLFKEKQFVMGIKASEVMKDSGSEELILIQGIIDVYFEEDGELVVVDYKSDWVDSEEQLVGRYKVQLEYYRRALEQMQKKRVKEMIIYSLPLAKEIRID
ncbi:MAG TPA: UvrD-helicase domain-containing protein [Clostridiales bacterium]|nr:UvrD-helicase domain-containing protein [Clostridiales bacterium]